MPKSDLPLAPRDPPLRLRAVYFHLEQDLCSECWGALDYFGLCPNGCDEVEYEEDDETQSLDQ